MSFMTGADNAAFPADISSFLEDLNPTLVTSINADFAKVEGQTAPTPIRRSGELGDADGSGGSGSGGPLEIEEEVEDLDVTHPRVDLDKLVSSGSSIVTNLKSDAWKTRKEAMEDLIGRLPAGTRLKPGMGKSRSRATSSSIDD